MVFLENHIVRSRLGWFVFIRLSGTDRDDAKLPVAGANNPTSLPCQQVPAYHYYKTSQAANTHTKEIAKTNTFYKTLESKAGSGDTVWLSR